MTYTVSITSQGQISIPAQIRKKLGFYKNNKAFISIEEGKMIVEPVRDFLELRGSLKTNKKALSNSDLHDFVAASFAKEYAAKVNKTE